MSKGGIILRIPKHLENFNTDARLQSREALTSMVSFWTMYIIVAIMMVVSIPQLAHLQINNLRKDLVCRHSSGHRDVVAMDPEFRAPFVLHDVLTSPLKVQF